MADATTYFYNSMLARSLLNLTPMNDQCFVWSWVDLLDSSSELNVRTDYMWYLLKCLQSGTLSSPFNEAPPSNLQPLYEILPSTVYEQVVKKSIPSMNWMDEFCLDVKSSKKGTCPSKFLQSQPVPRYGTICYGCVIGSFQ